MDRIRSRRAGLLGSAAVVAALACLMLASAASAQVKGENGRVFYISSDASGNQRVFSSKVSGRGRKVVSPVGLDPSSVAVSPNGRVLAITGGRAADRDDWIFLGKATGGRFRKLVKGSDAGFSPNGRKIVFVARLPNGLLENYEIRTVKTNGKGPRKLLDPPDRWIFGTQFTPDGKRIVFTATVDPNVGAYDTEVYSIRARDGRGERQITDDGGFDIDYFNPDVSPDGKRLAVAAYDGVATRRSIVTVPIGGGPIDIIATPDSAQFDYNAPMYSPDGRRMLFERSDSAFDEYYLIFQNRLTGTVPNQALATPPVLVPSPPASQFGAFDPVWAPKAR